MSASRVCKLLLFAVAGVLSIALSACGHSAGSTALPGVSAADRALSPAAVQRAAAANAVLCSVTGTATPAPTQSYQHLILNDGPSAYYQLADAATVMADSGPNNIAGTYGSAVVHGAAAMTAAASNAATFPGGSTYNPLGYAYTPKTPVLQPLCPTLEAWFSLKAANTTSHDLPIIVYGSIGRGARYGLFVHGLGGGQQCFQVQLRAAGQPAFILLSHARLSLNTVYHVVATFDGANVATYINGVVDGVYPYSGNIDYTPYFTDGLQIGGGDQGAGWGSASFPGTIAQAAVYAKPLMAVQVENHYLAGRLVGMLTELPADSDSFVDSIAMNSHFDNPESIYETQFSTVEKLLVGSGIRHIRAGITYVNTAYPGQMKELAAAGVHASYVVQNSMTQAQVQAWPGIVGPSFEQYEAPNEQDDVGNANWLPECIAFQKNFYSWVKSDLQLAKYPVLGPSIVKMADAQALGSLSSYMDYGNTHDYFDVFNPGTYGWGNIHPPFGIYGSIEFNLNIARVIDGTKPIQATETGYGTVAGNPLTLDYRTHLRYMTRLFFEQFNGGIVRSYSYEFMDEGGTAPFNNFGLVTTALQPKPAYTGITSLIARLSDPGTAFPTTPLTYELTGFTDPVHHTLLQKRNGHYELAVWLEVPDWVTQNSVGGDIIVPPQTIQLTTAKHFSAATMATMDETGAMTSAPLPWTGTSTPITITDKVSLIDIAP